jgi:hypothetical protein
MRVANHADMHELIGAFLARKCGRYDRRSHPRGHAQSAIGQGLGPLDRRTIRVATTLARVPLVRARRGCGQQQGEHTGSQRVTAIQGHFATVPAPWAPYQWKRQPSRPGGSRSMGSTGDRAQVIPAVPGSDDGAIAADRSAAQSLVQSKTTVPSELAARLPKGGKWT